MGLYAVAWKRLIVELSASYLLNCDILSGDVADHSRISAFLAPTNVVLA